MKEDGIQIVSNGNRLAGTICLPEGEGRFPFVLMVHGSGPLDRDENMKGQKLNIFNSIAHHLADMGIASLRYDKRGCAESSGNYYTASHSDLVQDAIACFDALAQSKACVKNEIYVLGHSEGTVIAAKMSIKRPSMAGIILLCPFVQSMESILIMQSKHIQEAIENLKGIKGTVYRIFLKLTGSQIDSQRKFIKKLQSSSKPTIRYWHAKVPAKWLREVLKIEPQEIYEQIKCPVLLIGGEKDIQCDPADVGRIAELVKGTASAHVIRDLTHVLRVDERKPSIFRYAELIRKPVEPIVLNLTSHWLRQRMCEQK